MDEVEVMTPEMAEEAQLRHLETIYGDFAKLRDEWVRHRSQSGVEGRWRRAQQMFEGKDPEDSSTALETVLKEGPTRRSERTARRSRVVINIVAPKVEAAVARMAEILLPVDDRNWSIRPTPDPEMSDDLRDDQPIVDEQTGMQATVADAAKAKSAEVKRRAENMQRRIDDALNECGYNGVQRQALWDSAKLGTGVIKGPLPTTRRAKLWREVQGAFQAHIKVDTVPASHRVDPWDVFPDPACGNDHQRGQGVIERGSATRKELRRLAEIPGFDPKAIGEVLRESPKRLRVGESRVVQQDDPSGAYEVWYYYGEVDPHDFEALAQRTGLAEEEGVELDVEQAILVVVNDRVIGALPPWWDETLPFDFMPWLEADDSPFGYGIPDRTENQQRVVNAAWRQLMDNAGYASGAQIVVLQHLIEPADGKWELAPVKVWKGKEDLDDARKAFHVVEFPDRLQNLLAIVQSAMQFADQEASLPQMMQGDQGGAPDTVGGMTLLMNNANSPLRHRVKLYDDNITRPHITRYYDYFMANDPDPEIKGDFEVDARGSSSLIERDIQNQAMLNVAQLTQNPVYGPLLQQKAAQGLRAILKSFKVDPDEFVPTDEELQQQAEEQAQQPPAKDPKVEATEIQAAVKREEIADRKEERAQRAQIEEQNAAERAASISYNSQREQGEYEIAMKQLQTEVELFLAKLAHERAMSIEELKANIGMKTLELDAGRQLFNAEAQLKASMGSGI